MARGQPEKVLPAAEPARGEFSPDGQYLVVGSPEDYRIFDTASWRCVFRLPRDRVESGDGTIQFSPDNSMVAVQTEQLGHTHLLAPIEEGYPLCFSADGSKLVLYNSETKMLMVWDLRLVHRSLATMGLDWEISGRIAIDQRRPTRRE